MELCQAMPGSSWMEGKIFLLFPKQVICKPGHCSLFLLCCYRTCSSWLWIHHAAPPQSRHYKHEPPFPPCASLLKKMRPQRLLTRPPEELQENGLLDSITNSSTQDKLMFKRQKASQSGSRHQKLSRTAETLMMMLAQIANVHSVLEKPWAFVLKFSNWLLNYLSDHMF